MFGNADVAPQNEQTPFKPRSPYGAVPNAFAAITPAFNRAKALPEPQQRSARLSLYEAAKKHADGVWRAEANKNVRKPPDFLYAWLDPDYKTPATTPVTTPAPKP